MMKTRRFSLVKINSQSLLSTQIWKTYTLRYEITILLKMVNNSHELKVL